MGMVKVAIVNVRPDRLGAVSAGQAGRHRHRADVMRIPQVRIGHKLLRLAQVALRQECVDELGAVRRRRPVQRVLYVDRVWTGPVECPPDSIAKEPCHPNAKIVEFLRFLPTGQVNQAGRHTSELLLSRHLVPILPAKVLEAELAIAGG